MIAPLITLAARLRAGGVLVSTAEVIDCATALEQVDRSRADDLRAVLKVTLLKRSAGSDMAVEAAVAALLDKTAADSPSELQVAVADAVKQHSGMTADTVLTGDYHADRVLRRLKDALAIAPPLAAMDDHQLETAIRREVEQQRHERLGTKRLLSEAAGRRLDGLDFLRLRPEQQRQLLAEVDRLARRLQSRRRRRQATPHGAIDVRRTIRKSLSTGGVPVALATRSRPRRQPELVVLADVSGSVATFSRFSLRLVHVLVDRFTSVRAFAFVDDISEVTRQFRRRDFDRAVELANSQAGTHGGSGHSDYGRALRRFVDSHLTSISGRSTVLILGDARNNYHSHSEEALAAIASRCHRLLWLNPEPKSYWDTADSLAGRYGRHCQAMYECRNLDQLRTVIDQVSRL